MSKARCEGERAAGVDMHEEERAWDRGGRQELACRTWGAFVTCQPGRETPAHVDTHLWTEGGKEGGVRRTRIGWRMDKPLAPRQGTILGLFFSGCVCSLTARQTAVHTTEPPPRHGEDKSAAALGTSLCLELCCGGRVDNIFTQMRRIKSTNRVVVNSSSESLLKQGASRRR